MMAAGSGFLSQIWRTMRVGQPIAAASGDVQNAIANGLLERQPISVGLLFLVLALQQLSPL
jgi:hypothetical protein